VQHDNRYSPFSTLFSTQSTNAHKEKAAVRQTGNRQEAAMESHHLITWIIIGLVAGALAGRRRLW